VHVVVKNAPLPILLGLQKNVLPGGVVDFGHFTIDCRLVYDTDGPTEKEVDFVKVDFASVVLNAFQEFVFLSSWHASFVAVFFFPPVYNLLFISFFYPM
jgi:hypothetical protein